MSLPLSTINVGTQANDGTGATVRDAFSTVNSNFSTLNTAVSALQSNAVTAATIVSLTMTGNLVANNITANTNLTSGTIQVSTGVTATLGISPAPVISGFSSISTTGYGANEGNISASGSLVSARNAYVTGNIYANTLAVTSAIQFANLTTTQINTIGSPTTGMTVYNYTSGNIQVYNGTKWANITLS